MPKETVQRNDQGPLSQTMRELEAKNAEVGGVLFSPVGKGKERAFLFPTYVVREEAGVTISEFLLVNAARPKLIQCSEHAKSKFGDRDRNFFMDPLKMSQSIARAKSKGGYKDIGKDGERLELWFDDLKVSIGTQTTKWRSRDSLVVKIISIPSLAMGESGLIDEESGFYKNFKLVNPGEGQVETILAANMQRVKGNRLQEVSQGVTRALRETAI